MNKIFRVYKNSSINSIAIGYLVDENESVYTIRVQNGSKNKIVNYDKTKYSIKSIYEPGSGETYEIKTKASNGDNVTIELSKACFGGCG